MGFEKMNDRFVGFGRQMSDVLVDARWVLSCMNKPPVYLNGYLIGVWGSARGDSAARMGILRMSVLRLRGTVFRALVAMDCGGDG
jgi:hypothetical protein